MLFVLLNWCYVSITAFITGFVCLLPFERLGYRLRSVTGAWMAGQALCACCPLKGWDTACAA